MVIKNADASGADRGAADVAGNADNVRSITNRSNDPAADPIMPIGKHKGRPVAEVMATDPQYIEWLALQGWFADKYKPVYNFITMAGPPSEMTPEHNALQVKFLDDDLCIKVAQPAIVGLKERMIKRTIAANGRPSAQSLMAGLVEQRRYQKNWPSSDGAKKIKDFQRHLAEFRKARSDLRSGIEKFKNSQLILCVKNRAMEEISDVTFTIVANIGGGTINFPYWSTWGSVFSFTTAATGYTCQIRVYVEIKPSLGDDYPAVLRQMKDQIRRGVLGDCDGKRHILCYGTFAAAAATLEQVTRIFNEAGITVVAMDGVS